MLSALRNFALTFVIAALIFGAIAYFIVGFVMDTLSETISPSTAETTPIELVRPEDIAPDDSGAKDDKDKIPVDDIVGETFNILLVGTDYQPDVFDDYDYESKWEGDGFPDKRNRPWGADMLVILRIDKENRKFMFCSIPRNTRVMVDGNYTQLGDIYAEKGIDYLCGKVTGLTGLVMNYYAAVSVSAIEECVDAVGGIKYYVPEDMKYEDELQGLVIDLEKGTHQIDGAKAAQLLRYVGYANGNTGRMSTVVSFLQAMLAKFTNITYATKIPAFYTAVVENIETNFTADDLINNLDLLLAYSKFESVTVSYPGSAKVYDGVSYFEPATASALDLFETYK